MAEDDPAADMIELLRELSHSGDLLFPGAVSFSEKVSDLSVQVAFQWTHGVADHIFSYANESPTTRGGMHVEGFSTGLTEAVRTYARLNELVESTNEFLLGGDIREGLTAIIRTHCDDPWFEPIHDDGVTGRKLGTVRMREFVYWATRKHLSSWLDEHPIEATLIVKMSVASAHDRVLARSQWDQSRR